MLRSRQGVRTECGEAFSTARRSIPAVRPVGRLYALTLEVARPALYLMSTKQVNISCYSLIKWQEDWHVYHTCTYLRGEYRLKSFVSS
jgi:hypothetical protein